MMNTPQQPTDLISFLIYYTIFIIATIGSIYAVWYKIKKKFLGIDSNLKEINTMINSVDENTRANLATVADYMSSSSTLFKQISDAHLAKKPHASIISATCKEFGMLSVQASTSSKSLVRSLYEKYTDIIKILDKKIFETHSVIELTEKGKDLISKLHGVVPLVDAQMPKITEEIKRQDEDCQRFGTQSNLMLLSRLILKCDRLLRDANPSSKELKNASQVLTQLNYNGDPTLAISVSLLIYILEEAVRRGLLPDKMLKLINEANNEYEKFIKGK
jgi:hypothetical protein